MGSVDAWYRSKIEEVAAVFGHMIQEEEVSLEANMSYMRRCSVKMMLRITGKQGIRGAFRGLKDGLSKCKVDTAMASLQEITKVRCILYRARSYPRPNLNH